MSGPEDLSQLHLADLHELAAERGISGYRLLRREELIERLSESSGFRLRRLLGRRRREEPEERSIVAPSADEPARVEPSAEAAPAEDGGEEAEEERERRRRRRRGRRGGRRGRERLADLEEREERAEPAEAGEDEAEPEATEQVSGVLEITRQRHGFLRGEGLAARDDDVYVSASQVRRCALRSGDLVTGPARPPRRGERHRALVRVEQVNGGEPPQDGRPSFESLTPAAPSRLLRLQDPEPLVRAVRALVPLAYGQRVLVRAAPRSGRTTLLRGLARAIAAAGEARVIVLLIDERPEEVPAWREAAPGVELALAPADLAPAEQVRVAQLALERARRLAEAGEDAVLLCDSLSRLAVAAGGVAEVKRLFGSGRELAEEGAGSLTVIATAFADGEDGGDAERAVITTETALITLDQQLAEQGIAPALRPAECRAVGEAELLDATELARLRSLRAELAGLEPATAAARLRGRVA
jgi:transcription termination factor Rho